MEKSKNKTLRYSRHVVCGYCEGTGIVKKIEQLGHYRTNESIELCDECKGGGMLTVNKRVEIEVIPKRAESINNEQLQPPLPLLNKEGS